MTSAFQDDTAIQGQEAAHRAVKHARAQRHHHHSHAEDSRHKGGHHLLQVEDLSIGFLMYDPDASSFFGARKVETSVISHLSISVHAGEILAVVGASGAGKTLLADALLGFFEPNAIVTGTIWFDGELQDAESLVRLRGKGISLIPQSTTSLDPLMSVGKQVRGFGGAKKERESMKDRVLKRYGLAGKAEGLRPFQLSGGMARRVLLSTALVDEPKLIIADEPTPGLDLELAIKAMSDLRDFADQGKGILLITHDIELALRVADRVAVFKDGTVVEETAVASFASPDTLEHPFTKALWHALPEHGFALPQAEKEGSRTEGGGPC